MLQRRHFVSRFIQVSRKEREAHLLLKQGPSVSNRAASRTPVLGIGRVSYDGVAEWAASRTAAGPRSCPPRSHSCRTPPMLPASSCKSIVSICMVEEERRLYSPRTRAQLQATLLDPPFRPCFLAAAGPPRGSGSQLRRRHHDGYHLVVTPSIALRGPVGW